MRPGEPELHAGGQRGVKVKVDVVVLGDGGGGLVDLREHGRHPFGGRRGGGQEAHFGAMHVESSVGDKTMKVDIQTKVTAKSLDYCEHAGVQRLHGGETVALLHRPAHVPHHCPREALRYRGQQRLAVTQAHGERPREG